MKKFVLICLLVAVGQFTFAKEQFCENTDGLDQISSYLYCQNKSSIAACAGLGALAAGKITQAALNKSAKNLVEETRTVAFNKTANNLYKGLGYGFKDLKFKDVNTGQMVSTKGYPSFDSLPEGVKKSVFPVMEKPSLVIAEMVNAGQVPTAEDVAKRVYILENPGKAWNALDETDRLVKVTLSNGILENFKSSAKSSGETLKSFSTFMLRGSGRMAPVVLGGAVSATAYVAGELADAITTGCSEKDAFYINRNPENGCKVEVAVNKTVLETLRLSDSEKLKVLKDPQVCDFYKKLNAKLLEKTSFEGLECKDAKFILKTKSISGTRTTYSAQYYPGTKNVKQINVSDTKSGIGKPNPIELGPDSSVKNIDSKYVAENVIPLRLFIEDARQCCTNSDDTEAQACLSAFNGTSSPQSETSIAPASGVK